MRDDLTRFVSNKLVFVSPQQALQYKPQHVRANDLVFTCWGTIGQVGIIPENASYEEYIISNKQLKLSINRAIANPLFCFYYFASKQYVEYIRSRNIGGAVPGINLGILKSLPIALPSLEEQARIVRVLGAYDDLIANNMRRIELLAKSARLLFEEWFVRLRYPGHEHDKIVDGVPQGWQRKKLGEVFPLSYGKALPETKRLPGEFLVYGSSGEVGTHQEKLVPGPGIVVGRKGNVGSVYWVDSDFWPIDTVYFVAPKSVSLFGYHMLSSQSFENSDAAVPGLNRDYAHGKELKWPPAQLRDSYEQFVKPIFVQRGKLIVMNAQLRAARDLLLPRLMDGRIEV